MYILVEIYKKIYQIWYYQTLWSYFRSLRDVCISVNISNCEERYKIKVSIACNWEQLIDMVEAPAITRRLHLLAGMLGERVRRLVLRSIGRGVCIAIVRSTGISRRSIHGLSESQRMPPERPNSCRVHSMGNEAIPFFRIASSKKCLIEWYLLCLNSNISGYLHRGTFFQ